MSTLQVVCLVVDVIAFGVTVVCARMTRRERRRAEAAADRAARARGRVEEIRQRRIIGGGWTSHAELPTPDLSGGPIVSQVARRDPGSS